MLLGIKEFHYADELYLEFDIKISQFDDLVRINFPATPSMLERLKRHTFKKIAFYEVSPTHLDDSEITAQFTSTNRPYVVTPSMRSGFLRPLFSHQNNYSFKSFMNHKVPDSDIENYFLNLEIAGKLRKHDRTVHKIAKAFSDSTVYTMRRMYTFLQEHEIFSVFSAADLEEYNPNLLQRNPKDFTQNIVGVFQLIRLGHSLHIQPRRVFTLLAHYNNYHGVDIASRVSGQFVKRIATLMGHGEYALLDSDLRETIVDSVWFSSELTHGVVVRSVLSVNVPASNVDFTKNTYIEPFVYIKQDDDTYRYVSIASMFGNTADFNHFLDTVRTNSHETGTHQFFNICPFTNHWLVNRLDESTDGLNAKRSILGMRNIVSTTQADMTSTQMLNYINSVIEPMVDTVECLHCQRAQSTAPGLSHDCFDFQPEVAERFKSKVNLAIGNVTPYFAISELDGVGHLCGLCRNRYEHTISLYGGYFKNGVFISDYTIQSSDEIEIPSHTWVQDYDYSPRDLYHLDAGDINPNLGIELEVDGMSEDDVNLELEDAGTMTALTLSRGKDYVYLMHDGSLNHGFEIATYPANIHSHMNSNIFNYKKAFQNLVRAGYRGHDSGTAGLHIHLDRSFFGSSQAQQLYRAALMAYIMESNWDDFVKFSRRRYHHVDQWAAKKDLKYRVDSKYSPNNHELSQDFLREYDYDKYVAFNISHSKTFELRIFRSTLNYETYIATLQFVHNFAKLVKNIDLAEAQQITFKDIIAFESHTELNNYIRTRFGEDYLN